MDTSGQSNILSEMENMKVDLKQKNICNGVGEAKESKTGQNSKKVMPDMVEAGDGAHVDDIIPESSSLHSPATGDLNLNETFRVSSSRDFTFQGEDVFKDPKTFDYLQQLGNNVNSRDLRRISLYRKFDPLVESTQESPRQAEPNQENAMPITRNGSGENAFEDLGTNELPPETVHNLSQRELLDSYFPVPDTPGKLSSQRSDVYESPGHSMQKVCVEISTLNMSPRTLEQSFESPKSLSHSFRQSTPQSYSCLKARRASDSPNLKDFEEMILTKYKRGNDSNEKLKEEIVVLREILMKQENVYREDLNFLEQEIFDARGEVEELKKQVMDQQNGQDGMKVIMEEYEKTVSRLISERDSDKERYDAELETLIKEIEQLKFHLDQQEKSFSDLYIKYENSKTTLKQYEEREKIYKEEVERYHAAIKKMEKNYEILREHASEKLERANQELTALKQNHQIETSKLKAAIKKYEVKLCSLEETILQKTNENSQLTKLCDELINKVGMDDHVNENFQ